MRCVEEMQRGEGFNREAHEYLRLYEPAKMQMHFMRIIWRYTAADAACKLTQFNAGRHTPPGGYRSGL